MLLKRQLVLYALLALLLIFTACASPGDKDVSDTGPGPESYYTGVEPLAAGALTWLNNAEHYMEAFKSYYLEGGTIRNIRLESINLTEDSIKRMEDGEEQNSSFTFRTVYLVLPQTPSDAYWEDKSADESGWVTVEVEIRLTPDKNGSWVCDDFRSLSEKAPATTETDEVPDVN